MQPVIPLLTPQRQLFTGPVDSDLKDFLQEAIALLEYCPDIVESIESDLDARALKQKLMRQADARWHHESQGTLPGVMSAPVEADPSKVVLYQGRQRTSGFVVAIAIFLRGFLGTGFKACSAEMIMAESQTLSVLFANLGAQMPKASTLTDLVNAVSASTHSLILDAQIAQACALKWDDFEEMFADSTHVEGNTAWPTDSGVILALVERLVRVGTSLPKLGLPAIELRQVRRHLEKIAKLARAIALAGKGKNAARMRKQDYKKLLDHAHPILNLLPMRIDASRLALNELNIPPSRILMAKRGVDQMSDDLQSLKTAIEACNSRVFENIKVAVADKVLSVSDPDAGYIEKGQRVPVIGYKPQVARSKSGFITALLLPQGNASDSGQLIPMLDEVNRRTGVMPNVASFDDGYASGSNVQEAKKRGINVISINGAKGKDLTDDGDWNSDAYAAARAGRSCVESLFFTLKEGFDFGAVARRGLASVHVELLGKAIAYNICRSAIIRERKADEAEMNRIREARGVQPKPTSPRERPVQPSFAA